jgi:hypothetical protein
VVFVLKGNAVPAAGGVQASMSSDGAEEGQGGPDVEETDTPAPLTHLAMWLAIPAAVTLAATGWLWYRALRRRPRCDTRLDKVYHV